MPDTKIPRDLQIIESLKNDYDNIKDKTFYPDDVLNCEDLIILIDYIKQLQQRLSKQEKELDSYKRLIENLKELGLGTEELDYDWEENPITNFEPFDFDYYVDNWFECEELEE